MLDDYCIMKKELKEKYDSILKRIKQRNNDETSKKNKEQKKEGEEYLW